MIVFDDAFVPWNSVFMCGEWQFTRDQAWMFGVFHRLFGTCHKVISTERIAGTAKLMAEYNGPDYFPDIDLAAPNMAVTNIAKYMFANSQHEASKLLSDISGGLLCTVPNYRDWNNPERKIGDSIFISDIKSSLPAAIQTLQNLERSQSKE